MRRLLAGFVVLALSGASARATVVLPADLGGLARDARSIARGRVVSVESRWTEDRRGIESLVTMHVETYLKGELGDSLQFRVPGGQLGRFRSITVGAPQFAAGQRIIVFLGARGPSVPYVLGLGQGVFRLSQSGSGWTVNPPPMLPAAGVSARQKTTKIVRGDPGRAPMALADFERLVRSLAGGAR